jgi:hypothetical protein
MMSNTSKGSFAPQLSGIRTFLFGALALVWFVEMVLWGFPSLSEKWTIVQNMNPPGDPQLAAALFITHAARAAAKAVLGVMAVFGLRSKNPSVRTALFLSMALVPPLNILFQFREQGFPLGQTVIAIILTTVLWGTFFLFREPIGQPEQKGTAGTGPLPSSRSEIFQDTWFAVNAAILTLMAFLFLFWPRTALGFTFPYLSGLLKTDGGGLSSLIASTLTSGAHLFALAIATWIATIYFRSIPALRQAITVASALHAGLMCLWPLRQMIREVGGSNSASSILSLFVPLLVGWMLFAAFSYRARPQEQHEAYT